MTYESFEDAFYFVSSASPGENVAVVSRTTGALFLASDLVGHDDLPNDLDRNDEYLEIPHKMELNLGMLVVDFVRQRCPEKMKELAAIFLRPAAFSRFKIFLAQLDLLEEWYAFESDQTRKALLGWCQERGLRLEERGK